jgi:aryl-alcohol dehydrogenase-like predicted oxidoreductase
VEHSDALRQLIPEGMTMAEMALRFILMNDNVGTTIPDMRKQRNVLANTAISDGNGLATELYQELKKHRWDKVPNSWSQ